MRFCPKCRNFYNDADLMFCTSDGVPLINLDESDKFWNEGISTIKQSEKILRREIIKQRLTKILTVTTTTIITTLIISVIVLRSWIYLNPTDEKPKTDEIVQVTNTNTNTNTNVEIFGGNVNLNWNTNANNSPTPRPTISPTPTATETPTPTPTPTPILVICDNSEIEREVTNQLSAWRASKENQEYNSMKRQYLETQRNRETNTVRLELFPQERIEMFVRYIKFKETSCTKAVVNLEKIWWSVNRNGNTRNALDTKSMSLVFRLKNKKWIVSK